MIEYFLRIREDLSIAVELESFMRSLYFLYLDVFVGNTDISDVTESSYAVP